jgi:hypothetical protein
MKKILLSVALLCSFGTVAMLKADICCSHKQECCVEKPCCKESCEKKRKSCCKDKVRSKKAKQKTMSQVVEEEKSAEMTNDRVESE